MSESSNISTGQFFSASTPANHSENAVEDASTSSSYIRNYVKKLNESEVRDFFDVVDTCLWIDENGFKRVALQFPDSFLHCAIDVSRFIEECAKCKTFVLADTSYRSCCVDEVAAEHSSCDAIVHYGDACLSLPSEKIPVRYVLGKLPVDVEYLPEDVEQQVPNLTSGHIIFLTDAVYSYAADAIMSKFKSILPPNVENFEAASLLSANNRQENDKNVYLGRRKPNFPTGVPVDVIFIGSSESPFLPLWLISHPNCQSVLQFDPATKQTTFDVARSTRQLRKRLFLVEKLKDANTVGLVVGSVGVHGHREAVQRMRKLCKTSGKKIYVISVGKVNVPKLSNFSSDIDVFVLLSCPFGILLDSSDFYRPVLSFFEAEVALNPSKSWAADGGWTAEFASVLEDAIGEDSEDVADMSLVSGKIREKWTEKTETQNGTVSLYTAGDYFNARSWKGLDDEVRVNEQTSVEEGRSGIAQGYEGR